MGHNWLQLNTLHDFKFIGSLLLPLIIMFSFFIVRLLIRVLLHLSKNIFANEYNCTDKEPYDAQDPNHYIQSPLLPLYRIVHEIFTSYSSSFNSLEVIGSFSSFRNLLPSMIKAPPIMTCTNGVLAYHIAMFRFMVNFSHGFFISS